MTQTMLMIIVVPLLLMALICMTVAAFFVIKDFADSYIKEIAKNAASDVLALHEAKKADESWKKTRARK